MVGAGTWAWLSGSNDPSTPTTVLVAIGGAAVTLIGRVGRKGGSRSAAKPGQALGALGLVVAPITAALGLLQLGTDPSAAFPYVIATFVALALWARALGLQAGLPFRIALSWLALAIVFAVVAFVIAGGLGAAVGAVIRGLGVGPEVAAAAAVAVSSTLVAVVLGAWATDRPDRQAVPGAVRRAVFGHALPGDLDLLAAGPGPILRRRAPTTAEVGAREARLAELDAQLASQSAGARTFDDAPKDPEDS
jgi:hypothetical protein